MVQAAKERMNQLAVEINKNRAEIVSDTVNFRDSCSLRV